MRKFWGIVLTLTISLCLFSATRTKWYRSIEVGTATIVDAMGLDDDPDTLVLSDTLASKNNIFGCEFKIKSTLSGPGSAGACSLIIYGICNSADTLTDTIVHGGVGSLWTDSTSWTKIINIVALSGASDTTDTVSLVGYCWNIKMGTSDVPIESLYITNTIIGSVNITDFLELSPISAPSDTEIGIIWFDSTDSLMKMFVASDGSIIDTLNK